MTRNFSLASVTRSTGNRLLTGNGKTLTKSMLLPVLPLLPLSLIKGKKEGRKGGKKPPLRARMCACARAMMRCFTGNTGNAESANFSIPAEIANPQGLRG